MSKPKAAPQVPGEPTNDNPEAEGSASTDAGTDAGPALDPSTPITLTAAELQAMVAAEVAKAVKAAPAKAVKASIADLPDQSEIDSSKIKSSVLSKQGWVVPDSLGANPAAKAL